MKRTGDKKVRLLDRDSQLCKKRKSKSRVKKEEVKKQKPQIHIKRDNVFSLLPI